MDKHKKHVAPEGKGKFELDVDRMINEGMAGGTIKPVYGHEQIGETHEIPEQKEEK
ncbi:hypothetical protein ACJA3J_06125 [Halobacillus sp. SY10]|uniref:Uncharacterized protein n=1 Tax=Halobacillus aidingensis TaxID=240303 RepID=A0A1H0R6J4_HALAD|nr:MULTISPECIES: hypothetical protein [Halobacillus]SDP25114.1 hypothetical protein SAMN05421677_11491 [Halobacillus aidingensis]